MIKKETQYFIMDNPNANSLKAKVRRIINEVKCALYKCKLNLSHPLSEEKKYNVAICAIFKNEAPYLKEWIEFHKIVGIEHFYMYNNNSEDGFRSILEPYIEDGLVTLIEWPYQQQQMESYKDCISKYASEAKWLGFVDLDEFIVPKSTDTVYEFLKDFEKNRGSVNIYWKLYGTSGLLNRDINGLITEDFTTCWPKYCDIGKCFYNTLYGFDQDSEKGKQLHHKFWANWNGKDLPPVNIFDKVCLGNINKATTEDFPIQINHYFTKSYKEYAMKRAKGDVYFAINPHDEAYFFEHEMKCTDTDYSAYRFLVKLKLQMGKEL